MLCPRCSRNREVVQETVTRMATLKCLGLQYTDIGNLSDSAYNVVIGY